MKKKNMRANNNRYSKLYKAASVSSTGLM